MPNLDIYSFLAVWFENLRKNTFKVQVVNDKKDDSALIQKISQILPYLQDLRTKEFVVKVSNQKDLNTSNLEVKLDKLISAIQNIKQADNSSLEGLLKDLISFNNDIKKVEVINNPEIKIPDKMNVKGEVSVSNFPKMETPKPLDLSPVLKTLQDLINEVRDLKLENIQGLKEVSSGVVGVAGSRAAHKITDGTKNATITTVGSKEALDVNLAAGSVSVDTTGLATSTKQSDGSQKTQIVDAGGEGVTVTGGKLDVNASVDTTGLALDATLTGGTQKTQIVDSGGEAVTVTGGKLDVNASVDTTGLATSAKQDDTITELQTLLNESTFTGRFGEVQATPTVNTLLGRMKSVEDKLDSLLTELGQKTEPANTQTISGTVTANAGTNLNTSALALESGGNLATIAGKDFATQTTLALIKAKTDNLDTALSGVKTGTDKIVTGALTESDFDTKVGALTETAPATDTASSGLNGRLQRIAQRISSLIALIPTALTGSGNFKVAVQEAIPAGTNNIGDVDVLTIAAGDNNIGNVDIVTVPADPFGANADAAVAAGAAGSISAKLRSISRDLVANIVLAAGTNAIGKLAANSGVDIGDVDVTSIVPGTGATNLGKAEDAGHTSGDVGVMALGIRTDVPNAANPGTTADYAGLSTDMVGGIRTALYETDFAVLGTNHVKKYYTNAGAVTDGIVWSPAAGKRWYVTDIFINVSAAATVTLEDDLAGGDSAVWKAELAANSGWSHHFGTPLFSGEDAADLIITTSAGNVYVTVTGYEI